MRSAYRDPAGLPATVDLVHVRDRRWTVSRVETRRGYRGRGGATRALGLVCADADCESVTLILVVDPQDVGYGALTEEQLFEWYARFRFVTGRKSYVLERTPTWTPQPSS